MNVSATAKKVLHIGKYFPPHVGGMETYLHNLMHALAALKINPCALVHQSKISLTSVEESFSENGFLVFPPYTELLLAYKRFFILNDLQHSKILKNPTIFEFI